MGVRRLIWRAFALHAGLVALAAASASAQQVARPAPGAAAAGPELVPSAKIPGGVVEGKVLDAATGKPLAGAAVFFPGTEVGTLSDDEGRFRVETPTDTTVVLRVQILGYVRQDWELDISEDEGLRARVLLVQAPAYNVCDLQVQPLPLEGDARTDVSTRPPR